MSGTFIGFDVFPSRSLAAPDAVRFVWVRAKLKAYRLSWYTTRRLDVCIEIHTQPMKDVHEPGLRHPCLSLHGGQALILVETRHQEHIGVRYFE